MTICPARSAAIQRHEASRGAVKTILDCRRRREHAQMSAPEEALLLSIAARVMGPKDG